MCQFFSAILTKQGKLLHDLELDSHEDIISEFGLRDSEQAHLRQDFVRLEYVPDLERDLSDKSAWTLKVDEKETPDWFDHKKTVNRLWRVIRPIIISDHKDVLTKGVWILTGNAKVDYVKNRTLIKYMNCKAQVEEMCGSSQVGVMCGSSQVGEMYHSSQVGTMWDSSQVVKMWNSSQVGVMCGSSQVGKMWSSSQVGEMCNSSQVREMCGSSQVGEMYHSSRVVHNNSQVGILKDFRTKEKTNA